MAAGWKCSHGANTLISPGHMAECAGHLFAEYIHTVRLFADCAVHLWVAHWPDDVPTVPPSALQLDTLTSRYPRFVGSDFRTSDRTILAGLQTPAAH